MSTEKTPALLIPKNEYDEMKVKNKICTKRFIVVVLASFLTALIVALCLQFLFPFMTRSYKSDVDVIKVYDGTPIEVRVRNQLTMDETLSEKTKDEPWHLDFLINPTRLCDTLESPETDAYHNDPEVKLLMLVPSATDHFAQRKAIRKTWGSDANKPHGPVRLGFVLGTNPNTTEEGLISRESEIYGDIIQANFEETYRNLTTKSILMLKWVSKHCPHAQYFLKTTDDTFVNLSVLTKILQQEPFAPDGKFIGGYIQRGAQPVRGSSMEYFVSETDYPDEEYPPYAAGSAYVTTGPTAVQLFEATKRVKPMLPMDDVFVTGLCADEIEADRLHEPTFRNDELSKSPSSDIFSSLATIHSVAPDDMDKLWNEMTKLIFDITNFDEENFFSGSLDSMDPISESGPMGDFSNLWNWVRSKISSNEHNGLSSKYEDWKVPDGKSRIWNWPINNLGNLGNLRRENANLDPLNMRPLQNQLDSAFNRPGSQINNAPVQEPGNHAPLTWQKTFIFPLPLNRASGSNFNLSLTHLLGK